MSEVPEVQPPTPEAERPPTRTLQEAYLAGNTGHPAGDKLYSLQKDPPPFRFEFLEPEERPLTADGKDLVDDLHDRGVPEEITSMVGSVDSEGKLQLTPLGEALMLGDRPDESEALNSGTSDLADTLTEFWKKPNLENAQAAREGLEQMGQVAEWLAATVMTYWIRETGDMQNGVFAARDMMTGGYGWVEGKYWDNITKTRRGKVSNWLANRSIYTKVGVPLGFAAAGVAWNQADRVEGLIDSGVDAARDVHPVAGGAALAVGAGGYALARGYKNRQLERAKDQVDEFKQEGDTEEFDKHINKRIKEEGITDKKEQSGMRAERRAIGNVERVRGLVGNILLEVRPWTDDGHFDAKKVAKAIHESAIATRDFATERYRVKDRLIQEKNRERVGFYIAQLFGKFAGGEVKVAFEAVAEAGEAALAHKQAEEQKAA